ncbi:MAG: transporter substrate-binding domain-containing protein [Mycolicibacterium sp.]|uniref:transporter substrate-binding domain-containing protein n=1 Tax=Mycolicibacterium sp. TaxID=2320850 RepID=UPI003D09A68A
MKRWRGCAAVIMLVALFGAVPASGPSASAQERTVTVAVYPLAPLVIHSDEDRWTGFTIELWEQIAERLGWTTNYLQVDGVAGQLQAVSDGRADMAAGGIAITAERGMSYDFSQPVMDAGLQILVPENSTGDSSPGLRSFFDLLYSRTMLVWLVAAVAISVIPAHLMWLFERRHEGSMVSSSYFPGIFQSFAWGFGALAGAAPDAPRQWVGRCIAILWGFAGIIFVALYTANLTATLTVEQFESRINGPSDLYDVKVCTVPATTASAYLRSMGITPTEMPTIEDCYQALRDDHDAVVFDAPVLRYYAAHKGVDIAGLAGPPFHDEDYGLLFRLGSDLRRPVDGALLEVREDGTYQAIYQRWFGSSEQTQADEN